MSHPRRAFTMIELAAAIAILVILAGILVVGIKGMTASSRQKATRLTMETLRSMLGEVASNPRAAALSNGSVESPLDVSELGSDRYAQAVILTQRIMRQIMISPSNKQILGQTAAERFMKVCWSQGVSYEVGDHVEHPRGSNTFYECLLAHDRATPHQPPDTTYWSTNPKTPHTPILTDAWGNPLIFVPRGGLRIINPLRPPGDPPARTVTAPSGKPFFASAGEDQHFRGVPMGTGNFQEQDEQCLQKAADNLYSFEN